MVYVIHIMIIVWKHFTYLCSTHVHFTLLQVSFVDHLDMMNPSFEAMGPLVESCTEYYPERVNAEFVQVATSIN